MNDEDSDNPGISKNIKITHDFNGSLFLNQIN